MARTARDPVTIACTALGAAGVVVSAYIHYRLWSHLGYKYIHLDSVLGVDLARSMILQAATGVVLAVALVATLWVPKARLWVALAGVAFSMGALVAYYRVRTATLLGFSEGAWIGEAKVAVSAEVVATVALGALVARILLQGRTASTTVEREPVRTAA